MGGLAERSPKARGADARKFYDSAPLGQSARDGLTEELYPR